ncbi:uncharacterized protein VTP21DRAFT_3067 [Calcarisporiella thermophila]|uniref:uncharacterized protein n=1 Tax=Calcarisporiella thermophila TaxID=911321 RepID=UPI003742E974
MASALGGKLSREDYRRQKDLEAARKAGTAPAEVDEEGREINPHIPQYISKAPWYLDTGAPSLKHQRNQKEAEQRDIIDLDAHRRRGKAGPAATKYRKGACENCGAMTHKTRDCVERPRKLGAKWTQKDIKPDELVADVDVNDYDAKRDRWSGYDAAAHMKIMEEYEKIEEARRKLKANQLDKEGPSSTAEAKKISKHGEFMSDDEDGDDEERYAEQADMVGQKVDTKSRTTVRNLRIREDTAKYLLNLDLNSAYYDPKTRSMRDNPNKDVPPEEAVFAGDNFVRYTGESSKMAQVQMFAWESSERGGDAHLQANPTQAQLLHSEYVKKKEQLRASVHDSILAKYGGEEHLKAPPKELLLAQTENYVEYSRTGRVIKGQERAKAKSKYQEDVLINNHTAVWGSFWADGRWGYKCCRSFIKNSYCTGLEGIEAANASNLLTSSAEQSEEPARSLVELHQEQQKEQKKKGKRKAENDRDEDSIRRKVFDISDEQLEDYQKSRQHYDDPMANYVDK